MRVDHGTARGRTVHPAPSRAAKPPSSRPSASPYRWRRRCGPDAARELRAHPLPSISRWDFWMTIGPNVGCWLQIFRRRHHQRAGRCCEVFGRASHHHCDAVGSRHAHSAHSEAGARRRPQSAYGTQPVRDAGLRRCDKASRHSHRRPAATRAVQIDGFRVRALTEAERY